MIINHDVCFKFLPVSTIKQLLSEIPDDYVIWPNAVGNLSVFRRIGDNFDYCGIIDFLGNAGLIVLKTLLLSPLIHPAISRRPRDSVFPGHDRGRIAGGDDGLILAGGDIDRLAARPLAQDGAQAFSLGRSHGFGEQGGEFREFHRQPCTNPDDLRRGAGMGRGGGLMARASRSWVTAGWRLWAGWPSSIVLRSRAAYE